MRRSNPYSSLSFGAAQGQALSVRRLRVCLEPRMLFDGAAVAAAVAEFNAPELHELPMSDRDATELAQAAQSMAQALAVAPVVPPAELAFVDRSVAGAEQLAAALGSHVDVYYLDSSKDGLDQMAEVLGTRRDIGAVHLFTHGSEGQLQLGTSVLSPLALSEGEAGKLQDIGAHLVPGGDFLVYGCNFAQGEQGQEAMQSLAMALGVDLAASTDLTGAPSLSGDWDLESHVGQVSVKPLAPDAWQGLMLLGINTAPVAVDDVAVLNEDTTSVINVLANDTDLEGNALSVMAATALSGSVTVNANGTLSYTPNANFFGVDTITYTIQDSHGLSALLPGVVAVTINPVDDLPVLNTPILNLLQEDTPLIFASALGTQLSLGDIDGGITRLSLSVPVGALTLASSTNLTFHESDGVDDVSIVVSGGLADLNAALNGLIYTPGADYNGAVNITLAVQDTLLGLLPITTVLPVDIAAVVDIQADTVTTVVGQSATFNVLANDTFENAGRVVSSHTAPAHGSVTIDAQGNALYTPTAGYLGSDSFTYTVTSNGTLETTTVTINNVPPNVPPVLSVPGSQAIVEDASLTFSAANGNALAVSDANGDTLTVTLTASHGTLTLSGTGGLSFVSGDGSGDATLQFSGTAAAINAALAGARFEPDADYFGSATVSLQASDGQASQTSSVSVAIGGVADGVADSVITARNTPVTFSPLGNDLFASGVSLVSVSGAAHGTVLLGLGNTVIYTPDALYRGTDTLTYTVSSGGALEQVSVLVTVGSNVAPVAGNLGSLATQDGALALVNAALAFTDADAGETLTFSATGLPAGLSINASTGLISGTVATHASQSQGGSYSVTVTATDSQGAQASAVLAVHVSNPAPLVSASAVVAVEDVNLRVEALLNATDPDGDALSIDQASALHGTVTISPDGSLSYTPDANFHGLDTITYLVRDADGATTTASIAVTVQAVVDLPVLALPTVPVFNEDTPLIFANLVGQTISVGDVDGQVLDIRLSVPVGALTLQQTAGLSISEGDGADDSSFRLSGTVADINAALAQLIYTPGADYNGPVSLNIDLGQLGQLLSVHASLSLGIAPVADIVDDQVSTTVNQASSFNVLANDTFENAGRQVTSFSTPSHGVVSINAQGQAVYTPGAGFTGSDTFAYTVTSNGTTETATVTVLINNQAPTAGTAPANQSALDGQTVSHDVSASFADPDGDALIYSASGLPAGLSIDAQTGVISGTLSNSASQSSSGSAPSGSFAIVVTASDGRGGQVSQSFNLSVANPGPSAVADSASVNEDGTLNGQVLGNDTDVDGDSLRVNTTPVLSPNHGVLVISADGSYAYTPNANFNGTDSFTYEVSDDQGGASQATVSITVVPVNDAPTSTAVADRSNTAGATVNVNESMAFSDADGDALSYVATGLPPGLVIDAATGVVSGSPTLAGNYTVTISGTDPSGASTSQTFTWAIAAAPNNGPNTAGTLATQAANDGGTFSLPTATAFSDPDGDTLSYSAAGLPPGLSINASTGVIFGTFTSDASQALSGGVFTVVVTASDGRGGSAQQGFTLSVGNPAPTASADSASGNEDTAITGNVLTNDTDADDDTLSVVTTPVAGPSHGTVVLAADGSYTYTPNANFSGTDSFTYTVTDGQGGSSQATVTLTVAAVNDAPTSTAVADRSNTAAATVNVNESMAFSDVDGDALSYAATGLPPGLVIDAATGVVSGSPTLAGNYTVTISGTDPSGASTSQTFTWAIAVAPNNGPNTEGTLATQTANDGGTFSLPTATAFSDPDGDTLSFSAAGLPPGLSIDTATGVISGTLTSDASQAASGGVFTVVVTASDGRGGSAQQGFTLSVGNPAPTANADVASGNEDTAITGNVLTNDSDADGDTLSVVTTPVAGPNHGTVVLNADGTFVYTPLPNYFGGDSFSYTVRDANGTTSVATVTVSVASVNDAPVKAASPSDQSVTVGTSVTQDLASLFTDVDGDDLIFSATGLPPGLSLDPSTGQLTGTLTSEGTFNAVLTANDGRGGLVTQTLSFSVAAGAQGSTPAPAPTPAPVAESSAPDAQLTPTDEIASSPDVVLDMMALQSAGQVGGPAFDINRLTLKEPSRVTSYDPLLLDAVNSVKRLDGVLTGFKDASIGSAVVAVNSLGGNADLSAQDSPVRAAVGDLNESYRAPLQVATPFGGHFEDGARQSALGGGSAGTGNLGVQSIYLPVQELVSAKTPTTPTKATETFKSSAVLPKSFATQLRGAVSKRMSDLEDLDQALS